MKYLPIALLVLSACASAPPPPPPTWSSVPRTVLDAFCIAAHAEGLAGEGTIAVVRTSRPLVTPETIAALAEVSFKPAGDTATIAQRINQSSAAVPVEIPTGSCAWQGVDAGRTKRDMMMVELSTPFMNPYAKNEAGSFARLSVGGEGATWYWIALIRRDDRWISAGVSPLGAHD